MSLKNLKAEFDKLNASKQTSPQAEKLPEKLHSDSHSSVPTPKQESEAKPKNGPGQSRACTTRTSRTSQDVRYSEDETESQKESVRKLSELTHVESAVRKVVKRAAVLADLCTGEDLETDARVIREACDAHCRFFDVVTKTWSIIPDHKTRLAATTLRRAYVEGTPVKREVKIIQDFRSTDDVLADLRQSPEGMRALRAMAGLGVGLQIEGEIIELEDVQQTGSENPPIA